MTQTDTHLGEELYTHELIGSQLLLTDPDTGNWYVITTYTRDSGRVQFDIMQFHNKEDAQRYINYKSGKIDWEEYNDPSVTQRRTEARRNPHCMKCNSALLRVTLVSGALYTTCPTCNVDHLHQIWGEVSEPDQQFLTKPWDE